MVACPILKINNKLGCGIAGSYVYIGLGGKLDPAAGIGAVASVYPGILLIGAQNYQHPLCCLLRIKLEFREIALFKKRKTFKESWRQCFNIGNEFIGK